MIVTAVTKLKLGRLYAALQRLNWTQSDLARASGLHPTVIGRIINLNARPNEKQANAIQEALGRAGEFFDILEEWPDGFVGVKTGFKIERSSEVQTDRLIDHPEVLQIAAPETENHQFDTTGFEDALASLTSRQQAVLKYRYFEGLTQSDTGKKFGLTHERIRQIENVALRKLRHPENVRRFFPEQSPVFGFRDE